jgi:hypothetical protein
MYQCKDRGALLFLPHKGHSKDVIYKKVFEDYIRDNVDNWFRWSKKMISPIEHMEDLILVTVCTSFTSWAAAAFEGCLSVDIATISLEARKSDGGGAQFFWRNIRGNVDFRNSPVRSPGYVFSPELMFPYRTRMFKNFNLRTNASLSGVFVQSALSFGSEQCGLQQNPFLTTLATIWTMRYK